MTLCKHRCTCFVIPFVLFLFIFSSFFESKKITIQNYNLFKNVSLYRLRKILLWHASCKNLDKHTFPRPLQKRGTGDASTRTFPDQTESDLKNKRRNNEQIRREDCHRYRRRSGHGKGHSRTSGTRRGRGRRHCRHRRRYP